MLEVCTSLDLLTPQQHPPLTSSQLRFSDLPLTSTAPSHTNYTSTAPSHSNHTSHLNCTSHHNHTSHLHCTSHHNHTSHLNCFSPQPPHTSTTPLTTTTPHTPTAPSHLNHTSAPQPPQLHPHCPYNIDAAVRGVSSSTTSMTLLVLLHSDLYSKKMKGKIYLVK